MDGMKAEIRNETEKDYRVVEELTRDAFWNLYVPGCDEHYLAHQLRKHPDFLPELAFVAEAEGKLVGSIMFTKSFLQNESGGRLETLTFGPVCVLPEYQHRGIGSALIRHGRDAAAARGCPAIIILGDPANYCRHGFKSSKDCGISDAEGNYPYGQLALVLDARRLAGARWKFHYSDVFNLNMDGFEEFDATFPKKEKLFKPSQVLFAMQLRAYIREE